MSVYLFDSTHVLLDGGNVATDEACCCVTGCCPNLDSATTITFSGEVIGCTGGTVTLPGVTWTKAVPSPGCNLDYPTWSVAADCGCQFNAQGCFPLTETGFIAIDETGGCADPFNFGINYLLLANIDCNNGGGSAQVTLAGSATPLPPIPACNAIDTTLHGPYSIPSIPYTLDVTYASDSDPTVSFHYIIAFA